MPNDVTQTYFDPATYFNPAIASFTFDDGYDVSELFKDELVGSTHGTNRAVNEANEVAINFMKEILSLVDSSDAETLIPNLEVTVENFTKKIRGRAMLSEFNDLLDMLNEFVQENCFTIKNENNKLHYSPAGTITTIYSNKDMESFLNSYLVVLMLNVLLSKNLSLMLAAANKDWWCDGVE